MNQELVNYIKQQLGQGHPRDEIKKALLSAGWQESDIEEGLKKAESNIPMPDPIVSTEGNNSHFSGELPGVGALLKESWGIFKKRWKTFAGVIVIPASIIFLLFFSFSLIAGKIAEESVVVVILPILVTFISAVVSFWIGSSLIASVVGSETNISVKESLKNGWKKLASYWWVSFLANLIVAMGFILFIIPGVIFLVQYSLALFVLYDEKIKGSKALSRSKIYIKGRWGSVGWRLTAIFLIAFVAAFGMEIIKALFKSANLVIVGQLISFAILILLTPFCLIYVFLLYRHLKFLKGEIKENASSTGIVIFAFLGFVIIIGGILSTTVLVNLSQLRQKARDAERISNIANLRVCMEIYLESNQTYPDSLEKLQTACADPNAKIKDPKTQELYQYSVLEDETDYDLCADLEQGGKKCANSKGIYDKSTENNDNVK